MGFFEHEHEHEQEWNLEQNMNSRERVYATLNFTGPDRLATECWVLPIAFQGREAEMNALLGRFPGDFGGMSQRNVFDLAGYHVGTYIDPWGCEWHNLHEGIHGLLKHAPLEDYASMASYTWPLAAVAQGWEDAEASLAAQQDKFTRAFGGNLFERMQFLRGTENLLMDLADEACAEVYLLRDHVAEIMRANIERQVRYAVDSIQFGDDWGSQRGLLISPRKWREFFKPVYKELFDIVLDAGKKIFFHSDGYIADIYPDFIELGVSAINSQVWCMGLDVLAPYAGQITFWGELDRQHLLPHGTPAEIQQAARQMYQTFYRNGGLIGQQSIEQVWHLENVEAALAAWGLVKSEE